MKKKRHWSTRQVRSGRVRMTKGMKLHLIQLLAQCKSYRECKAEFRQAYKGKDGNPFELWDSEITRTKKNYVPEIQEFRETWIKELGDIAITHLRAKFEILDEAARRGLEWLFDGDTLVMVENEAFDPNKPVSRKNPLYIERKIPRYRCHPDWSIRAVEIAAELQHGRRIRHEHMGEGGGEIKTRMAVLPAAPVSLLEWEEFYKKLTNGGGGGDPQAGNSTGGA